MQPCIQLRDNESCDLSQNEQMQLKTIVDNYQYVFNRNNKMEQRFLLDFIENIEKIDQVQLFAAFMAQTVPLMKNEINEKLLVFILQTIRNLDEEIIRGITNNIIKTIEHPINIEENGGILALWTHVLEWCEMEALPCEDE